jgi:hypothetical protein
VELHLYSPYIPSWRGQGQLCLFFYLYCSISDTQFTYWFFFTYPFPTLRSLSPDSTVSNPHILLSLPYFILLLSTWWLSYCYRCFLPPWGSQSIRTFVRNVLFPWLETPSTFGVPNRILQDTRTELFNAHKTGTGPVRPGRMGSLLITTLLGRICVVDVSLHEWQNPASDKSGQFHTRTSQERAAPQMPTTVGPPELFRTCPHTQKKKNIQCPFRDSTIGSPSSSQSA